MCARLALLFQLFFFFFFFFFFFTCYHAIPLSDTISPSQPLKDGQTITSADANTFALGFFSPGNSTNRRYVGIWYNKISPQTVVWVANRDNPIIGSNGILSVGDDGNLVLSSRNSTIWSTNITTSVDKPSPSTKAQLLDSGNLVVYSQPHEQTAWQSFDQPTHVFLPGMRLGVNRMTGFRWFLRSWRSSDDPGQGDYTFGWAPADPKSVTTELFLYKGRADPVWRFGPWVGDRYNGDVPATTQTYSVKLTVVDNSNEVYASYNNTGSIVLSMFVLDGESGTFQLKTWSTEGRRQWRSLFSMPQDDCDKYAKCGAFGLCNPSSIDDLRCSCLTGYKPKSPNNWYLRDGSDGCVRATNVSMCRNGEGFLKLSDVKVPDTTRAKTNKSMSLAECREACFDNCSCVGYTSTTDARVAGSGGPTGCILFHSDIIDTRVYSATGMGQDLYLRVDALELAKSLDNSKGDFWKKRLAILLTCIGLAGITFITSLAYWFYRKARKEWREQEERSLWLEDGGENNSSSNSPFFRFSTIVAATQNFAPTSFLGIGGFGPVYKGLLSNGQEVAVKRLSKNSGQGINEFKNEVRLISKLQHKNLVRTLGCCVSGDEKMLVYEFLPNKSLDKYIFDEEMKPVLDWSKRHEIIIGIARGVLYLHQDSRLKIIHRDLKASNVLLDTNMSPKISDFGMARIFCHNQNEENTNRIVGTYGYMPPEYAMEGLFSIKSDVYSFGIIILEIISGQKIHGYYNDDLSANLSGYAWKLWKDGNGMELVDRSIATSICGYEDEVLRCIQIGLLCVQEDPKERPTMLEVTFMLNNKSKLWSPRQPAFIIKRNNRNKEGQSSYRTRTHSLNEFTETEIIAR